MSIKKYITFLKVVETGSITKAAASLGHTQSGVTQLLGALEQDLGVKLLNRSRNGISLTPQGQVLLPYMKEVVADNQKLMQAVSELSPRKDCVIKIAAFTSVAVNWLPTIIKEYQKKAPEVRFQVIDCGYNRVEQELKKKKVHLGFVPMSAHYDFPCTPLYEDRLLAVLPYDHPFVTENMAEDTPTIKFPVSRFEHEPVISLIPEIDLDARTIFKKAHIVPNTKYIVEDDHAMLALAGKGLGICIVPELMLQGGDYPNIVSLELDMPASRTIGIAFPSGQGADAEISAFANFIKEWVALL